MSLSQRRVCTEPQASDPLFVLEDPAAEFAWQFKNNVFITTQTNHGCCVDSPRGTLTIVRHAGSPVLPLFRMKHGNIESISLFDKAIHHADPVVWAVEFPLKIS